MSVRKYFAPTTGAFAICLLSGALLAQQPAYDVPRDPHARDLVLLTQWFEGEFDNEEQLWFQNDPRSNTPEEDRHQRVHTMHRRLDLPEFGDHVFYVEEYKDNDPTEVFRQRFVIFSSEDAAAGIRMQQGFFRDPASALGAQYEPEKLASLTPADVFFMNECDVHWTRVADQFEGGMAPRACEFGEGDLRRYSVHDMVLSADKYWRVDATRLVSNDEIHVGHAEDNPTQMRRAHLFDCELSLRLEDGSTQTARGLRVHSQGGIQAVERDDNGESYSIRLRDKQYPFYDTRPDFLFMAILKDSDARSVAYAIADPDSRRLGVSANGLNAHCHREGFEFLEALDVLK